MDKEHLFDKIECFINRVKKDYQNNIINDLQYELMIIELFNLYKNSNDIDLSTLKIKFNTIKTIYLIMK